MLRLAWVDVRVHVGNIIGFVGIVTFQTRRAYGVVDLVAVGRDGAGRNVRVLVCRTLLLLLLLFLQLAVAAVWFVVQDGC